MHKEGLKKRLGVEDFNDYKVFPRFLMIEPINLCNARCVMCNVGKNESNREWTLMSMQQFERIVEQIEPYSDWIEMVSLYGRGEPLIDDNLEKKIERLKSIGVERIQVSTNAELLTKDRARSLLKAGLNDLRMSIDSIHKEIYEKIRPGLHYEKVVKNSIDAIDIRNDGYKSASITIRAVELPENEPERVEWIEFWKNQGLNESDRAFFIPFSNTEAGISNIECEEILYPCISLFSTMVIRSNGDVNLCCSDLLGEIVLGNVFEQSISDIWNNNAFEKYRKLHLNEKRNAIHLCRGCNCWGPNE